MVGLSCRQVEHEGAVCIGLGVIEVIEVSQDVQSCADIRMPRQLLLDGYRGSHSASSA